ncbi:MAG: YlxR family protein [Candidatus Promineifilaceae bacterium]|nr:YlxR family protein [Candidatus Promineifilaceae bacterium]
MASKQRARPVPLRTCVACRQKRDKRTLTRIVRSPEGKVAVDPTGKRPGRGAYLCEQPACWDKALHTNLLDRALQTSVSDAEKEALAAYRPHDMME